MERVDNPPVLWNCDIKERGRRSRTFWDQPNSSFRNYVDKMVLIAFLNSLISFILSLRIINVVS